MKSTAFTILTVVLAVIVVAGVFMFGFIAGQEVEMLNAPDDGKNAWETRRRMLDADTAAYARGANNALMGISLYSLELQLQGKRETFEDMSQVVMKRMKVTPNEKLWRSK